MSRVDDRRESDRVVYERDRDRRGDERIRYEDDETNYTTTSTRRPAPPPVRLRERSPSPLARARASERTFEDEERFLRERRYYEDRDDIDGARRRQHPPSVIPGDFDLAVTVDREKRRVREDERLPPPPPRPGHLVRRQSSLDTFDRRPARRAYDYDQLDDPRDRHPRESSVERTSERFTKRDRGRDRDRESDFTSKFDELRIDSGRYRPPPSDLHPLPDRRGDRERDYLRETEIVHAHREEKSRSPSLSSDDGRSEYPKKGKTRIPARLVSERALADLHYPFTKEGNTIVVQLALGQENIDDVLHLSRNYKKSKNEVVETKTTKIKTSSRSGVVKEERRREEYYTAPVVHQRAPSPPPPPPVPTAPVYAPPPVYASAPVYAPAPVYEVARESVAMVPSAADYATTVQIRDVSPARGYTTTASYSNAPVTSTELVRTRSLSRPPAVIVDADGPVSDYREEASVGPLAVVAVNDSHRRRRRHSRSHSHGDDGALYARLRRSRSWSRSRSRSRSHGEDGALYAHIHGRRGHRDDRYYYKKEVDYYEPPSRELVRAERTSNGELIVYEDDIEVEVPSRRVRIEKDKKGRMAISVPKYR